ncbi:hypothetical protein Efla_001466 [Eimeria flavescens]
MSANLAALILLKKPHGGSGLLLAALPCIARLSGDAADYRFLGPPEEVQLAPVGVQRETHRWGFKGHRLTVGFESSRVLQGTAFQVAVRLDSELTTSPVRVSSRFVSSTNAWREEAEPDHLYSYLADLAAQVASASPSELESLGPDAAAAAAYAAAAPPRRLEQLSLESQQANFLPLLPPRMKRRSADDAQTRRLEVCADEFTEADEKDREKILKKAGFDKEMACETGVKSRSPRRRERGGKEKLQRLALPPAFLPPNAPECEGDIFCGLQYCALVDCTRAITRTANGAGGGEHLLWIPSGRWELDLEFDWADEAVPFEGDISVEVREVPPTLPSKVRLRKEGEEEPPGNLALVASRNLATLFAALPGLQIDLTVKDAGFPNRPNVIGLFAAQLEFSFKLKQAIPRIHGPVLRLRFPAVACGTRREALLSGTEPEWVNQTLRECWDVHKTCVSMSGAGIFNSCEEGFVEMDGLEVRTITLADPKADVQEGTVVLHGVYPPTSNSTAVPSEFLLEFLQTYSKERIAEKDKIATCNEKLLNQLNNKYCFRQRLTRQISTTMDYASASVVASTSFFTPELQRVESLVRAQPNDDFPFPVTYTFVAPEEIYKGGLELYIPQRTFLYDPGPRERYNPYTRHFFKVATADLPIRHTGKGTKVTLYPVTMEKGESLTIHLPLKAFALASGVTWPAPQAIAYPSGAEKEYSLKMSNLRRKAVAEVTRIPGPVYTPGMVTAVVGPDLQSLEGTSTLAIFQLKFGDKIPSGKLKLWVTPKQKATATSSGESDPTATAECVGWLRSVDDLVASLECPKGLGSFEFTLHPSSLAAQYIGGWISLGLQMTKPLHNYPFFEIAARDSADSLIYSVDLLTPDAYKNPCIQRFSLHLIRPKKTGYSAKLLLVMQVVNCNNPAEPLRAMDEQVEPLSFSLPKLDRLDEIDYISSVTIERTSHPEKMSLSRKSILLGLTSKRSSFFRPFPRQRELTKAAAACRAEEGSSCRSARVIPEPPPLDPPSHINPSFSPKHLPRDPRLAAASVHLAFPHPRGIGKAENVPPGHRHAPQQRSPLAAPVSALADVPRQAVRIVADLVVDGELGAEADFMISEWGFNNFVGAGGEWCSARGLECYGHNWRKAGVFQWGASQAKPAVGELPDEWKAVKATRALQPVIEWRQSVSCDEIPTHLSVVILLTTKETADEYEALLRRRPAYPTQPEWADRPVHVHVIGFSEISYKPSEDPLKPLKQLPVTDTTNMIRHALMDPEMAVLAEEKVFVSFSSGVPLAGQYEADALINSLQEVLLLVSEEYAQSIVTVEICRHPVPPADYEFPWEKEKQREEKDPTYRAIQVAYNGEPLRKMVEFHIPESELKVYSPAKLEWQFRMACDGDFSPAD